MNSSDTWEPSSWLYTKQSKIKNLLTVSLVVTIAFSIGLVLVIWKRCSNEESFIPQNIIMYSVSISSIITSVGTLLYLAIDSNEDGRDKRGDDLLYFVAFPFLIIRELLIAVFAANRYAVCVYGLTYHLRMSKNKMATVILGLCLALYAALITIHQAKRRADSTTIVSSTSAFKITWVATELGATLSLCIFNLQLYLLAKSKMRRKGRVHSVEIANENQDRRHILVQNVKRTTGTLVASIFYGARMLPHATVLTISLWRCTPAVHSAGRVILLIKYIAGMFDPVVLCLMIKMVREGLRAEWKSMRDSIRGAFGK